MDAPASKSFGLVLKQASVSK